MNNILVSRVANRGPVAVGRSYYGGRAWLVGFVYHFATVSDRPAIVTVETK